MLAVKVDPPNFILLKGWYLVKLVLCLLEDTQLISTELDSGGWPPSLNGPPPESPMSPSAQGSPPGTAR